MEAIVEMTTLATVELLRKKGRKQIIKVTKI
jgi:hypothetical protein